MDVFVNRVPEPVTQRQLHELLRPKLNALGISTFHLHRQKYKRFAILTIHNQRAAEQFLAIYGTSGVRGELPQQSLFIQEQRIWCCKSRNQPDPLLLSALAREDAQKKQRGGQNIPNGLTPGPRERLTHAFQATSVHCGVWDYRGGSLIFVPYYKDQRRGSLLFGRRMLTILLDPTAQDQPRVRVDMPYSMIESVVIGNETNAAVTISLQHAPSFVELWEVENSELNPPQNLVRSLEQLALAFTANTNEVKLERQRVCGLDRRHLVCVGNCFVYRVELSLPSQIVKIPPTLRSISGAPSFIHLHTTATNDTKDFAVEMDALQSSLQRSDEYGHIPYTVKFQTMMLAFNSILTPRKVLSLLPGIAKIVDEHSETTVAEALQKTSRALPFPGASTQPIELAPNTIVKMIQDFANSFVYAGSIYDIANRHEHLGLVHSVFVTPTSLYLQGPELETKNRVLRKYPSHISSFLRVSFTDEDGDRLRSDPMVSRQEIFRTRFKNMLTSMLSIAGRGFVFLGFSHSSLRAGQCWFMAPFIHEKGLIHAQEVIKDLGDFSMIRSPAKCAARIGQTFSDATDTIMVSPNFVTIIKDVERNQRVFTDGVGTISEKLLMRVWQQFGKTRKKNATLLQIRYKGAKGVLALDSTLAGQQICLRPSMVKFEGSSDQNLEICGAAFKCLPMYLNRQFVKILEDLGVSSDVFLELQRDAINRLLAITSSTENCAKFLEVNMVAASGQFPSLVRLMADIGLHYKDDSFMTNILEITALNQLREMKYRARVFVPEAVTLYGMADETGFLQEGEIFCVTRDENGHRTVLKCAALITRAPALHPGDIQIVKAVEPPPDSPLQKLNNCIVFSIHGDRDLPSKLSGGDLDGDLFNVIWDSRLQPKWLHVPADYPRATAIDIGRQVTAHDMMDFFLTFMESDQLGYICNTHMQVADQKVNGTMSEECIKLAEMASTAVDFSKTGIAVDMSIFPKTYSRKMRPDFMADGPRLVINELSLEFKEEAEESNDDPPDILSSLDPELTPLRFYTSEKALGKLYRAIDETKFLRDMDSQIKMNGYANGSVKTLMEKAWDYVQREVTLLQWKQHLGIANEIKEHYETNLEATMWDFSQDPRGKPLTEVEVFSGTILGKKGRMPNKFLREAGMDMKAKFNRDVAFTVDYIVRGDPVAAAGGSYAAGGGGDYDSHEDIGFVAAGGENEALERSVACFAVAMDPEKIQYVRKQGALKSFKYVAAAVCLKELARFRTLAGLKLSQYHA